MEKYSPELKLPGPRPASSLSGDCIYSQACGVAPGL